jgi:hypothetical protein
MQLALFRELTAQKTGLVNKPRETPWDKAAEVCSQSCRGSSVGFTAEDLPDIEVPTSQPR